MKHMHLMIPVDLWEEMAKMVIQEGYKSRTTFVVEAIIEKMEKVEK